MNVSRQPRVALVTGASSGIGRSIAISLQKEGYVVFGAARSMDGMSELVAAGGTTLDIDVTDNLRVKGAVEQIIARHGQIDVLVNSAGYGAYGAIEDVSMDAAHRQFEVNVFGYARTIQAVLPHMRQQQSWRIVNITLVLKALDTHRPKARYHVGKGAGILLFLRRHLSDRFFDRVITAFFR
jgi:NAD(P)-dependent dehydrogenase (short-subunit alcohol dehydrogenase family)